MFGTKQIIGWKMSSKSIRQLLIFTQLLPEDNFYGWNKNEELFRWS